jgi:hypothetical protein
MTSTDKKRDFIVNYHREEIRGLFVLGIIATLLAVRGQIAYSIKFPFATLDLAVILNWLILYWGIYAVLMAVAVSDDIYKKSIQAICAGLARVMFKSGALLRDL